MLEEIKNNNFSTEEQERIKFFYLRGGFNYSKLDFTHKILMMLLRMKLRMKRNKTPEEKGMFAAFSRPLDCTRKENIKEIVEYACPTLQPSALINAC